tara:strand:+ start:2099 stop:2623 length:525 start_codon:yes stop_codon:yes gene_type:complete
MSTYSPTITTSSSPFIQVTTSDLTPYTEIQETQGSITYEATNIYYKADSIDQINAPIIVSSYNSDGNLNNFKQINVADPTQFQTVKNIDLSKEPIIFNGRTRIDIDLFPQENVNLYFDTQQVESADFLKEGKKFFSQDFMETYGFFDDYNDEIGEDIEKMNNGINKPIDEIDCE